MKQLTLIRHAKSDWNQSGLSDKERPLNQRGLRDAPKMAELFAQKYSPEYWLISPAKRAQQTAAFFLQQLGISKEHQKTSNALYAFNLDEVIALIDSIDNHHQSAALVYHNPTISYTANYYCHSFQTEVPTCAIIVLQFEVNSWKEITADSGVINYFDYPKRHDWANKN